MKVILLPGLDGTGVLFRPLLECLPPDIEGSVIALPHDEPLDYPDLVAYVSSRLPVGESYVLLGESFSGPLAVSIASQRPRGLVGLILCASFVTNPTPIPALASHLAGAWLFRFTPAFVQAKALLGGYTNPVLRGLLKEAHRRVTPQVMAQRIRSLLTVNASAALMACAVPVAYLRGQHDHVVPSRNLRRVRSLYPATQVFTVPAPHLVLQVAPEASATAIATFTSTLSSASNGPKSTTEGAA